MRIDVELFCYNFKKYFKCDLNIMKVIIDFLFNLWGGLQLFLN